MRFPQDAVRTAATGGGRLLEAATAGVSAVRRAGKPLHPRGQAVRATIRREGVQPPTGVPWLDEPGEDDVLVRFSRAVGLPASLPDIHGLAIRVPFDEGPGDLLLASTGMGRFSRFVLTGSRAAEGRPLTTLLPYRSVGGPLLIGAVARPERCFELAVAQAWGPWRPFGLLVLPDPDDPTDPLRQDVVAPHDADVSFDPLNCTVPGLENYRWVERLREPSYRHARRSRG